MNDDLHDLQLSLDFVVIRITSQSGSELVDFSRLESM